ncbi:MAG: heme-dependent oxidative N-demethylase family protein [Acetobacteraceae bacterium]
MDARTPLPQPGPPPLYLPFVAGPWRMAMGLVARPPEALIEIDQDYREQMALRRRLLAERRGDVLASLPCSATARQALLDLLARHLAEHYPRWFELGGPSFRNHLIDETWDLANTARDPLEIAGRLVQEDLCLVEPGPAGPLLTAAVLCFPSRWSLAAKLGRPLAEIHGPVPFYAGRLAAPVDRFTARLKPGHLVERFNWSIHDDPALFQPSGHGATEPRQVVTAENAGEKMWFRVERQTLSRLPRTEAILFTIKTYRHQLAEVVRTPSVASRLAAAVRALPEETARYKSLIAYRATLLAFLDALA